MDNDELQAVEDRVRRRLGELFDDQGACLTLVAGRSTSEVLSAFGGELDPAQIALADAVGSGQPTAAILQVPGGVLVVEPNGFQGSRPEVLTRVSAGARAASLFWSEGDSMLSLAVGAEVAYQEEASFGVAPENAELSDHFADLDFGGEEGPSNWLASGFVVLERFTGLRMEGEPPAAPIMVQFLTPYPDESAIPVPVSVPGAPLQLPEYSDFWPYGKREWGRAEAVRLTETVRDSAPEIRRSLASFAARRALQAAGLTDHPDLASTISSLDSSAPVMSPEAKPAVRRWLKNKDAYPTPPTWPAANALQAAVDANSVRAALDAVWQTIYAIRCAERATELPTDRPLGEYEFDNTLSERGEAAAHAACEAFHRDVCELLGLDPDRRGGS